MAIGSTILATDLVAVRNALQTILQNNAVADGYGQSNGTWATGDAALVANPAIGNTIDDAYQDSIFAAAAKLSNYYNITNPFDAVNAGNLIEWNDYAQDAATFVTDINTRHASPWTYSAGWDTTVTSTETTDLTPSNWNTSHNTVTTITFQDVGHRDAWFAAGGEIRVTASHSNVSNPQGVSWNQLCSELGTFTFSLRATDGTNNDDRTRKKYSELTSTHVVYKQEFADAAAYTANTITVEGRTNGTGEELKIRTTLNDGHTASPDLVPGQTTVNIGSLKPANTAGSVVITAPTFVVTNTLV